MDKARFESVAEKYLDSVYRAAVNYCKNTDDAADAVQNAFFKLMTTNTVFEDDEHIHRWLIRVAVNECKGFWRSFWHRNVISLDALHEENENDPVFCQQDNHETVSAAKIWDAVTALPSKYSIVLHLHYHEGYTVEGIAEILGLTPSNVLVRLHRGREKLKTEFEKGDFYE